MSEHSALMREREATQSEGMRGRETQYLTQKVEKQKIIDRLAVKTIKCL